MGGAIYAVLQVLAWTNASYIACALSVIQALVIHRLLEQSHRRARRARDAEMAEAARQLAQGSMPALSEGDALREAFEEASRATAARWSEEIEEREEAIRKEAQTEMVRVRSQCEALIERYAERLHREKNETVASLDALRLECERERNLREKERHILEGHRKEAEAQVLLQQAECKELKGQLLARSEERSRLSVEVERLLDEVSRLQKQNVRFFDKVAAQLRGPLQIVDKLASELCPQSAEKPGEEPSSQKPGEEKEKPRVEACARRIKARIGRLEGLVDQILDLCRIESAALSLVYSEVNTSDLVKACVAEAHEAATSKSVELTPKTAKNAPAVLTDARLTKKILRELISNAVHFTPRGGRVSVALNILSHQPTEWKGASAKQRDWLRVDVSDTGPGVPAEDRERIFYAFERGGDAQFTLSDAGPGLGLTLAKQYAKLLGGDILLESEVGRGSTFSMVLPVKVCAKSPAY
jgi:two-component system chemotaxis sensor kinase CheA